MDLTNSLIMHKGKFAGIVRAELMQAKFLHQLDSSIRFSVITSKGFKEVSSKKLSWLFNSQNIGVDYQKYQDSKNTFLGKLSALLEQKIDKKIFNIKRHYRDKTIFKKEFIIYPYQEGDLVYSCGWYGTKKEKYFYTIKKYLSNFRLVYTIYDLVMVKDNLRHLYFPHDQLFDQYLSWISMNCDACIYGGHTARIDTEAYLKKWNLRIPQGYWIKFGSDIVLQNTSSDDQSILDNLGIKGSFILAVGSFDHKKNYRILYQAFCLLKEKGIKNLPKLIIVGRKIANVNLELQNDISENPLIKDNIKIISCTDQELDVLYRHCLFTVLASLYEGWSLTLPESLNYGKLCVCSDVAPLKEIAEGFAVFVNPNSPKDWADNIENLLKNPKILEEKETHIKKNWHPISWEESTQGLYNILSEIRQKTELKSKIYYELGLLFYPGGLTGIPRTQMILARKLNEIRDDIVFFYMAKGNYYEISKASLRNLLSDEKLDIAVCKDRNNCVSIRKPLPFTKDDIVFSAGVGYDKKSFSYLIEAHNSLKFKYYSIIYDFTPVVVPHTHPKERVDAYPNFLKETYALSDFIFYGGKTAQKDGEKFQKDNGLPIKASSAIKFGSDFSQSKSSNAENKVKSVLKKYGISGNYILTVGTIEARKNQRILYEAYLIMQERARNKENIPQIIICGHPGWKTDEFRHLLQLDNRIKGKVIQITPSDEELDILYRKCRFTALPSFYEGWSLTLPESLNYGKFCLAADTPSLKEVGQDLIDYANPYDPEEWADKIEHYMSNPRDLRQKENLIKQKWHNTTWAECAEDINSTLVKNS